MGLVTGVNKFYISDRLVQWKAAMVGLAAYLFLYSIVEMVERPNKATFALLILFAAELWAVLVGWNLNTQYFSEFILLLSSYGLYKAIRLWVH